MSLEIKKRIDELLLESEQLLDPTTFVLNKRIGDIDKEIQELQNQCKHNFINGVCEFCYRGDCNE